MSVETLEKLISKFDLDEDKFNRIKEKVEKITKVLEDNGVVFQEHFQVGYYSHMISLVKRLEENEEMIPFGEEVLNEIGLESMDLSHRVLKPLFVEYNRELDRSEAILVAIHIQTAKNTMEGGE
ncbi:PRD domain-containing protein [Alkalibaculum sp. M08DMB]|uniref:PRD domain-containing protein n=1 Tax=Alkalibaculum sporogenes TaxID=2655001 RepID=A0A6A7K7W6_9FIRM|nr:PRD domain-containing protein [Alkalibaculum sporogenes]MPW25579.1 PRD domain-containing protein [Alkalibaculum sporogenes]